MLRGAGPREVMRVGIREVVVRDPKEFRRAFKKGRCETQTARVLESEACELPLTHGRVEMTGRPTTRSLLSCREVASRLPAAAVLAGGRR
jgi:hypothetical protein